MNQHETFVLPRAERSGLRAGLGAADAGDRGDGERRARLSLQAGAVRRPAQHSAHGAALPLAVRHHDVVRLRRRAPRRRDRREARRALRHACAHPVDDRDRGVAARRHHAAWREQPDAGARRDVRHADDRAERHGRRGAVDWRHALLGAGIQSRGRAGLPRGHRLARRVRADHSELHQDRARPEPGRL